MVDPEPDAPSASGSTAGWSTCAESEPRQARATATRAATASNATMTVIGRSFTRPPLISPFGPVAPVVALPTMPVTVWFPAWFPRSFSAWLLGTAPGVNRSLVTSVSPCTTGGPP